LKSDLRCDSELCGISKDIIAFSFERRQVSR
jgi:hypothetical protein